MLSNEEYRTQIGGFLQAMGKEIETTPPVKKIDWSKIIDLIIQMLPVILAFFQQENPED